MWTGDGDLDVAPGLVVPAAELSEEASRSGGPGGQHVNKSNTRVTLRWSIRDSRVLDERQRSRLLAKLRSRLTQDGELVVHAGGSRQRSRNRDDARRRIAELVAGALREPRSRKPTRPSRSSVKRRLDAKRKRSGTKSQRGRVRGDDG